MKKFTALMAIVLFLSACQEKEVKQVVYEGTAKEAILDNIHSRHAIRQYTKQQVSKEQIDTVMKSAIFAPSGLNKQP